MNKKTVIAILAFLAALIALLQQSLQSSGIVSEQAYTRPITNHNIVDFAMGLDQQRHRDLFLSYDRNGIGYYYGSFLEDVMDDNIASDLHMVKRHDHS